MINLDEMVDKMTKAKVEKQAQETRNPADDTFMSFKPEHTYLGRLLPNVANPANTFTPYEEYGFKSITGGGYIYAGRAAYTVGRKDIIKDLQWKTFSEGRAANDEATKLRSYQLFPQKKEMVNWYVIDDPVNPENNGKVKILRYSAKVNKEGKPTSPLFAKIQDSVFGDESDDVGKRAFDLTENGATFAIKVEKNAGGWNDYGKSAFKFPSDLGLSKSEIQAIYDATHDLEKFIPEVKSDEEIKELLDTHWYGNISGNHPSNESPLMDSEPDSSELSNSINTVAEVSSDVDDFLEGLEKVNDN